MRSYKGVVEEGTKRASKLGFPTINISLQGAEESGVYAARVLATGGQYIAAAFADPERKLLEAHILDFPAEGGSSWGGSGDLYSKKITIELHEKIRESMAFEDDDALRAAIADDIEKVREYFKI